MRRPVKEPGPAATARESTIVQAQSSAVLQQIPRHRHAELRLWVRPLFWIGLGDQKFILAEGARRHALAEDSNANIFKVPPP